jgi:hypothetical protein
MRRTDRKNGVKRSDEDPFRPNESGKPHRPRAARTLPAATLTRWILPAWLHRRAVSVNVATPKSVYESGEPVPVGIEFKNPLPIPITLMTRSPVPWKWHIDGHREASHVPEPRPDLTTRFVLDRGERRRFTRVWRQSFQISKTDWKSAERGVHTIGAGLDVKAPLQNGLYDETTVRIK